MMLGSAIGVILMIGISGFLLDMSLKRISDSIDELRKAIEQSHLRSKGD